MRRGVSVGFRVLLKVSNEEKLQEEKKVYKKIHY